MRRKKGRFRVFIDMTPMGDVTMLLLTFFMLPTQFKPLAEAEVVLPSWNSAIKLPEAEVMTITVTKDEHIFLEVDSQKLRGELFGAENALRAGVQVTSREQLADLLIRAR